MLRSDAERRPAHPCYSPTLRRARDTGGVSWYAGRDPAATGGVKRARDVGLGPVPALCSGHAGED